MKFCIYHILILIIFGCSAPKNVKSFDKNALLRKTDFTTDALNLINESCNDCDFHFDITINSNLKTNSFSFKDDVIYISSKSDQEASITVYTYLDRLGFKFYGPEDHWTYVPRLKKEDFNIQGDVPSDFMIGKVGVSYGLGHAKHTSLERSKQLWKRWNSRLRFANVANVEVRHDGHRFNKKYKNLILQNPEWRNTSVPFKTHNGKLCYDHPEVIKLYKKDFKERLLALRAKQDPPYILNIEPTDGSKGHCYEDTQSISNALYTLVNEVASYVKTIDNNAWLTLYAYNKHVLPPTFPIESNVLVGIVPDAFQRELPAMEMRQAWEKRHNNIYFLGYTNIPIWKYDIPNDWDASKCVEDIEICKSKNYRGFLYEVSASFFADGWNLFCISQTAFDKFNHEESKKDFYSRMLQTDELRDLFEILVSKDNEVYLKDLITRLEAIDKKTNDEDLSLRIEDMIYYAKYRLLYKEYKNDSSKLNLLLSWLQEDSSNLNVHSFGLFQVLSRGKKLDYKNPIPFQKKDVSSISQLSIPNDLSQIIRSNYEPINKNYSLLNKPEQVLKVRYNFDAIAFINKKNGPFNLTFKVKKFYPKAAGEIVVKSMTNAWEYRERIIYDEQYHTYFIPIPLTGKYSISFEKLKGAADVKMPNIPIAITGHHVALTQTKPTKYYFYSCMSNVSVDIPPKMRAFKVYSYPSNKLIFDGSKNSKPETVNFSLPKEGIYYIESYRSSFEIISEPHRFSLSPEAVWKNIKCLGSTR